MYAFMMSVKNYNACCGHDYTGGTWHGEFEMTNTDRFAVGRAFPTREVFQPCNVFIKQRIAILGLAANSPRSMKRHSVKLHLRHARTKRHARLSVVPLSARGVHPIGGRSAMLHRNLRG